MKGIKRLYRKLIYKLEVLFQQNLEAILILLGFPSILRKFYLSYVFLCRKYQEMIKRKECDTTFPINDIIEKVSIGKEQNLKDMQKKPPKIL